jgi:hypothetical protein
MRSTPQQVYNEPPELLTLFDCREPGAKLRLFRERRAWGFRATVENLGHGRVVLIVRPGGALGLAR